MDDAQLSKVWLWLPQVNITITVTITKGKHNSKVILVMALLNIQGFEGFCTNGTISHMLNCYCLMALFSAKRLIVKIITNQAYQYDW